LNLIVEQGNTRLKAAVFDNERIVALINRDSNDIMWIDEVFDRYHPEKGVMSSVSDLNDMMISSLKERLEYFILLDTQTPVPVVIEYGTPETLGKDRIAAVVGACYRQPDSNILVIDAGTAITYEVVEKPDVYKGGNISPGLATRFKALHEFTKRLPLINEKDDVPLIGTSTESAILAGVVNGIVYEMDGYIDMLKKEYGKIHVFLTGGHTSYFEKRLKNHVCADENLVLTGLNRILKYNAKNN